MRPLIAALALVMGLALPVWAQSAADVRTLAEQGDPEAQFVLGSMYRDGQGVEKDLAETLKWWEKAAERGNVDAQFALGNIYSGGYGVARDYVLSYMWFDITASLPLKSGRLARVCGMFVNDPKRSNRIQLRSPSLWE